MDRRKEEKTLYCHPFSTCRERNPAYNEKRPEIIRPFFVVQMLSVRSGKDVAGFFEKAFGVPVVMGRGRYLFGLLQILELLLVLI